MAFTSFNALPASCRCLFFLCDVFFLGTAFKIPSQISDTRPGMLIAMAGIAIDAESRGREDHD